MTDYQCGSCSYGSDDLDELQQHSHETSHHVGARENGAEPVEGKFAKAKAAAKVGATVLALAVAGFSAWKYKSLQSMAAELVVQLAESAAENATLKSENEHLKSENDYLKSATGAGKTLNSYRDL
ncbi:hypothetical protein ABT368_26370 [Streptomyces althioticus]|uniref:hypothetical protein n=1 Tax=Streptomyces althioticus TaxID=83380 RepID=UPI001875CA59|nr:hypothetical protein GCM10010243_34560 [Streptomyces matensis]